MSKISWKGGALLAPLPPVLVSCGTLEHPNVLTVAWTGIVNTKPPRTYISVRPTRFSYPIIKESGEFVLNLTTEELVRAATEELDVAQDVHDHPERLEELREGMAAEDEEIARLQERLNSAKSHADSLRDTDLRGKLLVAAFVLLALIVIMLALAL